MIASTHTTAQVGDSFLHQVWHFLFFGETNPIWQFCSFQWYELFTRTHDISFWSTLVLGLAWLVLVKTMVQIVVTVSWLLAKTLFLLIWNYLAVVSIITLKIAFIPLRVIGLIPGVGSSFKNLANLSNNTADSLVNITDKMNNEYERTMKTEDDYLQPQTVAFFLATMSQRNSKK